MGGVGKHGALGVWSPDPTLLRLASLGLAASAGTALVVDAASGRPPTGRTLVDIHRDGPTAGEISPARGGVAVIDSGDLEPNQVVELCEKLSRRWPAVVIACPSLSWALPVAPVVPLIPGRLSPRPAVTRGVWQPVGPGADPPGPGPLLPRLRPSVALALLNGTLPPRSRWVRAWSKVWEMPWE